MDYATSDLQRFGPKCEGPMEAGSWQICGAAVLESSSIDDHLNRRGLCFELWGLYTRIPWNSPPALTCAGDSRSSLRCSSCNSPCLDAGFMRSHSRSPGSEDASLSL